MSRIAYWQILIDRFKARLSSWKANLLFIGGRLTLIKSVLASLGGLGVGILSAFNKALLLKWRWRLFNFPNSLWVQDWCRPITMGRSKIEFDNLIIDISNMKIDDLVESDTCVWSLSNDDSFSVNSVRKHIDEHSFPSLFPCTRCPDDSSGAVRRLLGPWIVLPTKKNRLEGDPRPKPRDPSSANVRAFQPYAAIPIFKLYQSCPILGSTRVHVSGDYAQMLGFPWLDGKDPYNKGRWKTYFRGRVMRKWHLTHDQRKTYFRGRVVRIWHSTYGRRKTYLRGRSTEDVLPWSGSANMAFDLDVLPWPGNANMAFDLWSTEDVLPWPGNANMAFDLRPTEDVLPWPGSANMAFDLDVLSWPGNANMAFDLRSTEDVLLWPSSANMAFDLDVLPWPGNANMAFNLRSTEDVLPWPGSANMAFDLVPDLKCLLRTWCEYGIRLSIGLATPLHMFYIRRYLCGMHKDNYNGIVSGIKLTDKKERMSAALRAEACRMCHAGRASRKDRGYQKRKYVRTCGVSRKDGTCPRHNFWSGPLITKKQGRDIMFGTDQKYKKAGPRQNVSTKYVTEYEMVQDCLLGRADKLSSG
nr:reverse transcriptase domain, reverse transcriptase zinc-binding domain protein [Tanacetum cinerariifolium]